MTWHTWECLVPSRAVNWWPVCLEAQCNLCSIEADEKIENLTFLTYKLICESVGQNQRRSFQELLHHLNPQITGVHELYERPKTLKSPHLLTQFVYPFAIHHLTFKLTMQIIKKKKKTIYFRCTTKCSKTKTINKNFNHLASFRFVVVADNVWRVPKKRRKGELFRTMWASRPKLRILTNKYFLIQKNYISLNVCSKNASNV